jgi:hypothetical protein
MTVNKNVIVVGHFKLVIFALYCFCLESDSTNCNILPEVRFTFFKIFNVFVTCTLHTSEFYYNIL